MAAQVAPCASQLVIITLVFSMSMVPPLAAHWVLTAFGIA
jgi:hypothetical protein